MPYCKQYQFFVLFISLFVFCPITQAAENSLERGKFIIATEMINEGGFSHSVVYITENNSGGAFGLIINRPTPFPVTEVLPDKKDGSKIFFGGPMHTQFTFMLAEGKLANGSPLHHVDHNIFFGAGEENLKKLSKNPAALHFRTFAGFASWGPGQLQQEIKDGLWLVIPASSDDIFSSRPGALWKKLIAKWGGDWT